tara:strand:- start:278 stop:601 length:324 start_codon:yes stop_codon:yes gene_type:complete
MYTRTKIGATLSSATSTAVVTMDTSPNLPGTSVVLSIDYATAPTMDAKVEGSDDNSTFTALWDPAAVNEAGTVATQRSATVVLPKYIKGTVTAYTDGTAMFYVENAG